MSLGHILDQLSQTVKVGLASVLKAAQISKMQWRLRSSTLEWAGLDFRNKQIGKSKRDLAPSTKASSSLVSLKSNVTWSPQVLYWKSILPCCVRHTPVKFSHLSASNMRCEGQACHLSPFSCVQVFSWFFPRFNRMELNYFRLKYLWFQIWVSCHIVEILNSPSMELPGLVIFVYRFIHLFLINTCAFM